MGAACHCSISPFLPIHRDVGMTTRSWSLPPAEPPHPLCLCGRHTLPSRASRAHKTDANAASKKKNRDQIRRLSHSLRDSLSRTEVAAAHQRRHRQPQSPLGAGAYCNTGSGSPDRRPCCTKGGRIANPRRTGGWPFAPTGPNVHSSLRYQGSQRARCRR